MKREQSFCGVSRRQFLSALGAIAAVSSAPPLLRRAVAREGHRGRFVIRSDRFGRMFPDLPPFAPPSPQLDAALLEVGKAGGILDAKDALDQGPIALITDPALNVNNPNNNTHTAGTTFMAQFMDHDITFDLTSRLGKPTPPEGSPNERTPAFDLDSVYGGGPDDDPELYEDNGRRHGGHRRSIKFKVESGGRFEDLPRTPENVAIIADERNDEHMMLSGLHAAFLLFHNRAVDLLARRHQNDHDDEESHGLFLRARRLTTWHYQWMVLHEFLPLFIGQDRVDAILSQGRQFYVPRKAIMPVEFQGAAYRFGHSQVRPSYRANLNGNNGGGPFFGFIFDPSQEGVADPSDLRGGARAPRRFIGWQTFFRFNDVDIRPNKLIDSKISTALFHLPLGAIVGQQPPISLPQRNLLRHVTWLMPSGQSIARRMQVPVLSAADLLELRDFGHRLDTSTPLWYYILKEAELMEQGLRLGPVGARIVGEVIIGLLQLDRHSYVSAEPNWKPTLPQRNGQVTGDFRMVDFLTFAGVDPLSRGQ